MVENGVARDPGVPSLFIGDFLAWGKLHVSLGKIAIGGEVPTGDIGDLAPMDPGVLFALFLSRTKLGPIWGFDSFLGKVRTRPFLVII